MDLLLHHGSLSRTRYYKNHMTQRTAAEYCLSLVTALIDDDVERGCDTAESLTQEVIQRPELLARVVLGLSALAHDYLLLFCMERGIGPEEVLQGAAIQTYGDLP